MAMKEDDIKMVIQDRMQDKWPRFLRLRGAAPYATVGVVQRNCAEFGTPVLCMPDGLDEKMIAELLLGVAMKLLDTLKRKNRG